MLRNQDGSNLLTIGKKNLSKYSSFEEKYLKQNHDCVHPKHCIIISTKPHKFVIDNNQKLENKSK